MTSSDGSRGVGEAAASSRSIGTTLLPIALMAVAWFAGTVACETKPTAASVRTWRAHTRKLETLLNQWSTAGLTPAEHVAQTSADSHDVSESRVLPQADTVIVAQQAPAQRWGRLASSRRRAGTARPTFTLSSHRLNVSKSPREAVPERDAQPASVD